MMAPIHATRPALGRRVFCLALAGLWLTTALPASAADQAGEAATFVQTLGDRAVKVLGQSGSDAQARSAGMVKLLDDAVNIDLIARLVLGRHWRAATPAQQQEYLNLFRTYALDSLARRFSAYTGSERFAIRSSRPASDADTTVSTDIELGGGRPPVHVDWRVRREEGRLMIVDVVAEGVSLLVTNRDQFGAVASQRGVDGLLQDLRSRLAGRPVPPRAGPA